MHVEHLRGSRFALDLASRFRGSSRTPIVWDAVDCISQTDRRTAAGIAVILGATTVATSDIGVHRHVTGIGLTGHGTQGGTATVGRVAGLPNSARGVPF